jgi:hypothetical protein
MELWIKVGLNKGGIKMGDYGLFTMEDTMRIELSTLSAINDINFDYKKALKLIGLSTATLTLGLEPISAYASGTIDTTPIDGFFDEVYWLILKIAGYVSTPVVAWAGYNVVVSGTSSEKRAIAKSTLLWVVIGLGVIAGAPWASKAVIALWGSLF